MRNPKPRGVSLAELLVALFLLSLVTYLVLPRGNKTKSNVSAESAAQVLAAHLRQARETAMARNIPVAIAIPSSSSSTYSDTPYQLEGEVEPQPTTYWKIEQDSLKVVYFVGHWTGPNWTSLAASSDFNIANWWQFSAPPAANLFVFTPDGRVVSQADGFNGAYAILVAQGVVASGPSLAKATSPWTVTLTPAGDIEVVPGLLGGDASLAGEGSDTPIGATYAPSGPPVGIAPDIQALSAAPNNCNPAVNSGNPTLDVSSSLTLEVQASDLNGYPPYATWSVTNVIGPTGSPLSPTSNGGRFGNFSDGRLEWSSRSKKWVGRTVWTPAASDTQGGYSYQLECKLDDLHGGVNTTKFPVSGYLLTTTAPWVLYRTLGVNGNWELWRMDLLGQEHHVVAAIPNQDITYGQWTRAGDEAVFTTSNGVYRVLFDGSNLRQVATAGNNALSVCVSPSGESLYYIDGVQTQHGNKMLTKISLVNGAETKVTPAHLLEQNSNNLSCALINGHDVLVQTIYYSFNKLLGAAHFSGIQVIDATTGGLTSNHVPPNMQFAESVRPDGSCGPDGGIAISEDGSQLVWGQNGNLFKKSVNIAGYTDATSFPAVLGATQTYATSLADVHHPRLVDNGGTQGMIFVSGRGIASQIWYMPNLSNPTAMSQIPLGASNQGGDLPDVGPPR